jgi:hypothetical protein
MIFEDGTGKGYKAKVDANNRLHTQAVTETEALHATEEGDAYNINSGNISLSAAGSLLYIKNNEDKDLVVETVIIGQGTGTVSDSGEVTITANDTAGDLITDGTAVTYNANRNFGSSKTLTADAYKGKSGGTATGGTDVIFAYAEQSSRVALHINLVLPKGNAISIMLDPKLSSGSVKAYAAAVVYLKDPESV